MPTAQAISETSEAIIFTAMRISFTLTRIIFTAMPYIIILHSTCATVEAIPELLMLFLIEKKGLYRKPGRVQLH